MNTNRRRLLGVALGGLMMLLASTPALASDNVRLKVSVVHATKAPAKGNPGLKPRVLRSLKKTFAGYASFQELANHKLKFAQGGKSSVKLPNGKTAVVTYKGKKGAQHLINLAIDGVVVDLRSHARRLFYQAGLKHKNGILILAFYLKE